MKIYGFMIIKDEADILEQTINSLLLYGGFEKIFIFDNNSTDDSFSVASKFISSNLEIVKLDAIYSDDLKYDMVYSKSSILNNGDWFAILDGDEIYAEQQLMVIDFAEKNKFNCIEHNTTQFYFTDCENNHEFARDKPAIEQRKHYLLNYGEPRIFKYEDNVRLTAGLVKARSSLLKISPKKLLVYHFQYRSFLQVETRIKNRIENNKHSNNWGHVKSISMSDYVVPAKFLHKFSNTVITGLPKDANLFKIPNNSAYTMANLNWLKKNNALTPAQLSFFDASKWQRLLKKLW